MSEYIPTESAKIVIGVCGEQGSGKTVFLTCIFQSIWKAFPDDVIVDFERHDNGNAIYFQNIEDLLIARGPTQGTTDRALYPARIYVRPSEPLVNGAGSVLSVDLLDFAGRHFRSMADLTELMSASESDPEDIKSLREVNDTLERADAFVVLINSREIDPLNETPARNPFGPSVRFIIAHCRAERKPIALLFSQADQTPMLTDDVFQTLPTVEAFERQFTSDLDAAARGQGTYGVARRVSCYETVEGDLAPRRQTLDGSIWRREPAEIVLDLIRAAIPRINERIAAKREAERIRQEEQERASRRQVKIIGALAGAAVLVLLLIGILSMLSKRHQQEREKVSFLNGVASGIRGGKLASLSPTSDGRIADIVAAYPPTDVSTSRRIRDAINDLHSAFSESGQRLAAAPSLQPDYSTEIARFQSLSSAIDPRVATLPLLAARGRFLTDYLGKKDEDWHSRIRQLDESAQEFASGGDDLFSNLLISQSTAEKRSVIASWQARIDADPDVPSRLATIQNILASVASEKDPEVQLLTRKALAFSLITTILKRHENPLIREKLLTPLAPELAKFGDGEVRFEVLARDMLACGTREICTSRQAFLNSEITEADSSASGWSSGVDNILRSLLLDLPVEQRREIWNVIASTLQATYLFSPRADSWPPDITPLHLLILDATVEGDPTLDLIDRIAKHPIYTTETLYIQDRLTAIEVQRRVVPIYASILTALSQHSKPLPSDDLSTLGRQLSALLAARAGTSASLKDLSGEIGQALSLVKSVNGTPAAIRPREPEPPALTQLVNRLQRFLRSAWRDHCSALSAHEAPAECSNAA